MYNTQEQIFQYLRSKYYYHGIYFTLGPQDIWPVNTQLFGGKANPPNSKVNFDAIDAAINKVSNGPPDIVPNELKYTSLDDDSQTKFKEHGFYSHMSVIHALQLDENSNQAQKAFSKPDLGIISLNTNACFNHNFGLMQESDDPGGQLQWLQDTLKSYEASKKYAWIIGNVNPGSKYCNTKWARRYNIIVNRFQSTIRMQLFGSEHHNYFQLQWPEKGVENPFSATFQGGKASTLGQNPKFKIIDVDYSNFMPRKITTYEFDIDKANSDPNALATDLIKEVTSLPGSFASSLRPQDLYAMITKINNTDSAAISYNK